jgi:predicted DNA-binding transcriptional regulator AlpA
MGESFTESKNLIDVGRAAEFTGKRKSTLYKLSSAKAIPVVKVGSRLFFSQPRLEAWLAEQTREIQPVGAAR